MKLPKEATEFAGEFAQLGASKMAAKYGVSVRSVYDRRVGAEKKLGRQVTFEHPRQTRFNVEYPQRIYLKIKDGVVVIGSDAHYWPSLPPSTAHRGLVWATKRLKPVAVIMNGDIFDFPSASQYNTIGWENRPTLADELEAGKERLAEIGDAAGGARKIHPLGNHDGRFETRLANAAPEYAQVHGVHLKDHIPEWEPCWGCWINDDVVVKHHWKGGTHAAYNNTLKSGKSIFTGHLHGEKVEPHSDYNGTRWGVDCGTLAEPYGPQFRDYTEDNPVDWRSGFVVARFVNGVLRPPEAVYVVAPGVIHFEGKDVRV